LKAHYGKELSREIGEAGLEVLAVILYRGPSTRAEIDYIRGVNTTSTIRTLLARGLLERAGNAQDSREYLYRPTTALLAHIGASRIEDLPEYGTIASELKAFEASEENDRGPFDDTGYDRNTTDTDGGSAVA
jgi:segregation and condensation protein B